MSAVANHYAVRETCRICGSRDLLPFLEFGDMPLAGGFLKKEDFENEKLYPLSVCFCRNCKEVQILEVVPAEVLFKDYRYVSSTTATLSAHFREYAAEMNERFLGPQSLVVEFGCNDGVLLKPFNDLGVRTLGVEPAENIARIAMQRNCEIVNDFFNVRVADKILASHGRADLICANNVFAHIDDMHEPMRAIRKLLNPAGVFVCEVHYLLDLLEQYQYDMIYHEHMMHHSLTALSHLLSAFDMQVFDVRRVSTHAGSLRVYSQKKDQGRHQLQAGVQALLDLERQHGCDREETFLRFGQTVHQKRDALTQLVRDLRARGKRIIGYGASGRATVHLNFCGFDSKDVEYVVDASHERQGRYIPGVHIPIVGPEKLKNDHPDGAVLFAYNYSDEIMKKEKDFLASGGHFILPLPHAKMVAT